MPVVHTSSDYCIGTEKQSVGTERQSVGTEKQSVSND